MKVLTARVVDGKIDVTGDLEDGAAVAVLALGQEQPELTAEDEQELEAALEEIRAGHYVDGRELVAELKASSGSPS